MGSRRAERGTSALGLVLITLGVVGVLIGAGYASLRLWAAFGAADATAVRPVDVVLDDLDEHRGSELRVHGVVRSHQMTDDPCEHRFDLVGERGALPARYGRCTVPDMFSEGASVVVVGRLSPEQVLAADEIVVRAR